MFITRGDNRVNVDHIRACKIWRLGLVVTVHVQFGTGKQAETLECTDDDAWAWWLAVGSVSSDADNLAVLRNRACGYADQAHHVPQVVIWQAWAEATRDADADGRRMVPVYEMTRCHRCGAVTTAARVVRVENDYED